MGFYFLKVVFVRLRIRGRIIYKTLTYFLYLSLIIYPHVIEPINFSSMLCEVNMNVIWFGISLW